MSIEIYSDGSSTLKPRVAGWACALLRTDVKPLVLYGHLPGDTNNVGELLGLLVGCAMARTLKQPVRLFSDSQYALGVIFGSDTAVANIELVNAGRRLLESTQTPIEHKWIRGHTGIFGNELADKYAKYGRHGTRVNPHDMDVKYYADKEAIMRIITNN